MNSKKARVVVAVSGGGRSLQNFINRQNSFDTYEIVGVVSSSKDCGAVKIAEIAGVEVFIGDFNDVVTTKELHRWLTDQQTDWLVLAGFLKPMPIFREWQNRMINIHPALLPKYGGKGFYGDKVHRAVLDNHEKETGASIHFVNDRYDEGRLIAQSKVTVFPDDTPTTLAQRVFDVECKLYPRVLSELILGDLPLPKGEVKIYEF